MCVCGCDCVCVCLCVGVCLPMILCDCFNLSLLLQLNYFLTCTLLCRSGIWQWNVVFVSVLLPAFYIIGAPSLNMWLASGTKLEA